AATLEWSGTFRIIWGNLATDTFVGSGTGVSTVTTSGAFGDIVPFAHLDSIRFNGGLAATGTVPLTDPENASLVTLMIDKISNGIGIPLGRGTLAPISGGGALTDNQLTGAANPMPVRFKWCVNFGGPFDCFLYLPIPFTENGTRGAGIGGVIFFTDNLGKGSIPKFSIMGAPWTLGTAVITGVPNRITLTQNGVITSRFTITETRIQSGFAHGPASATSSTAKMGGVIQFVTPTEVSTSVDSNEFIPVFSILTLHFVPEPGLVWLLVSGIVGLVVIGRSRIRP
ncbi:MAG: hypothetical protein V3S19_02990, partial [Gemmatimonadales bacterium]